MCHLQSSHESLEAISADVSLQPVVVIEKGPDFFIASVSKIISEMLIPCKVPNTELNWQVSGMQEEEQQEEKVEAAEEGQPSTSSKMTTASQTKEKQEVTTEVLSGQQRETLSRADITGYADLSKDFIASLTSSSSSDSNIPKKKPLMPQVNNLCYKFNIITLKWTNVHKVLLHYRV